MGKLYASSTIADIKDRYDFRLSKSLGQNFLIDKNILDKIIEGSFIGPEDLVIEIGPGIGALTAVAAEAAGKVVAVEIDKKLIPILKETLVGYDNVEIVNKDVLKTDLAELIRENEILDAESGRKCSGVKIIGNLPYYITTPIIMKVLEDRVPVDSVTIMLQKEVADRIKASPGGRIYGALSVAVQYYCTVEHIANAPKEVFIPRPKVDSAVIRLNIRKEKPVKLLEESAFFEVVKGGFGQRRKTLANSLTGVRGLSKEDTGKVLEAASIDPQRRAETLSLEDFAAIANEVVKTTNKKAKDPM